MKIFYSFIFMLVATLTVAQTNIRYCTNFIKTCELTPVFYDGQFGGYDEVCDTKDVVTVIVTDINIVVNEDICTISSEKVLSSNVIEYITDDGIFTVFHTEKYDKYSNSFIDFMYECVFTPRGYNPKKIKFRDHE